MKLIPWTLPILSLFCMTDANGADQSNASKPEADRTMVELKYQFAAGDQWHYSLTEKATHTAISPGLSQVLTNDSSQSKHYQVVQVEEDGSAIVEVIVDRYQIDFSGKIGEQDQARIVYDTDGTEEPPRGLEGVKKSVGKPLARFRMSPSGDISDLRFLQEVQPQQLKQGEQLKGLPMAFPSGPVSIGKSWSEKISVELQADPNHPKKKLDFTIQTIYQLKSVEDDVAVISLNTIVKPRVSSPYLRGKIMQYLPQGTIRFDNGTGRIISRTEMIDRRELGVAGPKTVLMLESRKVETLIAPERQGLTN